MTEKSGYFVRTTGAEGKEKKPALPAEATATTSAARVAQPQPGHTVDLDNLPKYLGEGGGSNW